MARQSRISTRNGWEDALIEYAQDLFDQFSIEVRWVRKTQSFGAGTNHFWYSDNGRFVQFNMTMFTDNFHGYFQTKTKAHYLVGQSEDKIQEAFDSCCEFIRKEFDFILDRWKLDKSKAKEAIIFQPMTLEELLATATDPKDRVEGVEYLD